MDAPKLRRRVRFLLVFFTLALLASGLTAFPLEWETDVLYGLFAAPGTRAAEWLPGLARWIAFVHTGVHESYRQYPFLAYGTDWLAFAHILFAIAFIGPIRDPVRNLWVIEFGMIACAGIPVLALTCGPLRGIPFGWRLIDCSFGVFGIVPLWIARRDILRVMREA